MSIWFDHTKISSFPILNRCFPVEKAILLAWKLAQCWKDSRECVCLEVGRRHQHRRYDQRTFLKRRRPKFAVNGVNEHLVWIKLYLKARGRQIFANIFIQANPKNSCVKFFHFEKIFGKSVCLRSQRIRGLVFGAVFNYVDNVLAKSCTNPTRTANYFSFEKKWSNSNTNFIFNTVPKFACPCICWLHGQGRGHGHGHRTRTQHTDTETEMDKGHGHWHGRSESKCNQSPLVRNNSVSNKLSVKTKQKRF